MTNTGINSPISQMDENKAWDYTVSKATPKHYQDFIDQFPDSIRATAAKMRINKGAAHKNDISMSVDATTNSNLIITDHQEFDRLITGNYAGIYLLENSNYYINSWRAAFNKVSSSQNVIEYKCRNWSALLLTLFCPVSWVMYRKLFGVAGIIALIEALCLLVGLSATYSGIDISFGGKVKPGFILNLAIASYLGYYGNGLIFKRMLNTIHSAEHRNLHGTAAESFIRSKGGVSIFYSFIGVILYIIGESAGRSEFKHSTTFNTDPLGTIDHFWMFSSTVW